jgi:hypothetical protein
MKSDTFRHSVLLTVAGLLVLPTLGFAQQALSHVRVVRLSFVNGTVTLKRPGSTEWAKGLVNTPIQEGFELSTSANSYAEVEFENGSTARLGELSKVDFSQLALDAEGNKLNHLAFEQGYATFHFMPEHQDAYSVRVADATLTPSGKSEFRTDLRQGRIRVEVFNGSVAVVAPSGSVKLGKENVLEYNTGTTEEAFNIQHGIDKDSWDKWVDARDTQAQLALRDQAVSARGLRYGWSDLNTYGEWASIPGYGYGWAPYAPFGWTPYSMGMWSYYPGFGLTWISSEPWGWLPYHCGQWAFVDWGWFWMPGGCNYWQPALVTWYSGPGWIGWAPQGGPGRSVPAQPGHGHPGPGRPVHGQPGLHSVTAVPTSLVQNGEMITPQIVTHVRPADGISIERPPFQPPLVVGNEMLLKAGPSEVGARAPVTTGRIGPGAATHNTPAPATILMGGDAAKEKALLAAPQSFWGRVLGTSPSSQPLRARGGSTLGGHYAVGGTTGEFRGGAFSRGGGNPGMKGMTGPVGSARSHEFSRSGPTVLPHGQAAASSHAGGGSVHAGGGGFSRGASATTSVSSGAHSAGPSAGASPRAGGGHH